MFAAPLLLNDLIIDDRLLDETGAPASGSWEICHAEHHASECASVKKIVPEQCRSTNRGSSPE